MRARATPVLQPMGDRLCPICGETPQSVERLGLRNELRYLCQRCGLFHIVRLRAETLPELIRTNGHLAVDQALRAHIRKQNVKGEIPLVDSLFIDAALDLRPPARASPPTARGSW